MTTQQLCSGSSFSVALRLSVTQKQPLLSSIVYQQNDVLFIHHS